MSWKPIVVGVDTSPAAADAAVFAVEAARRAATSYHLVHATHDTSGSAGSPVWLGHEVRAQIVAALRSRVPAAALETLSVGRGHPSDVLSGAVADFGAELVVLGGKHHTALGRWLGGSTSLNVTRSSLVPMLVTVGKPAIGRVLVAVDQSGAAQPTLATAERYATLFGAELRALSVIEQLPVLPEVPQPDETDYYKLLEETVERDIWPLIRAPAVKRVLRRGAALDAIMSEAAEWRADLLVVGSHGKGWAKRVLAGSVTEGLINHLPTSLLVVPIAVGAVRPEAGSLVAANRDIEEHEEQT